MIPEFIFVAFQGTFAAITCGLIVGAFAERARFSAVLLFVVLWFTFGYIPVAHMVWFWAGPDAIKDAATLATVTPTPAGCGRRARSTSRAAPWSTSTPPWRAWSAPT
jgi:hypothetical protein